MHSTVVLSSAMKTDGLTILAILLVIFSALLNVNGANGKNEPDLSNNQTTVSPLSTTLSPCNKTNNCTTSAPSTISKLGDHLHNLFDTIRTNTTIMKSMIVLVVITSLVILFFIVKAIRLRKRRKPRKYGILTTSSENDDLEMRRLQLSDEEDEDVTIYDMNGKKK